MDRAGVGYVLQRIGLQNSLFKGTSSEDWESKSLEFAKDNVKKSQLEQDKKDQFCACIDESVCLGSAVKTGDNAQIAASFHKLIMGDVKYLQLSGHNSEKTHRYTKVFTLDSRGKLNVIIINKGLAPPEKKVYEFQEINLPGEQSPELDAPDFVEQLVDFDLVRTYEGSKPLQLAIGEHGLQSVGNCQTIAVHLGYEFILSMLKSNHSIDHYKSGDLQKNKGFLKEGRKLADSRLSEAVLAQFIEQEPAIVDFANAVGEKPDGMKIKQVLLPAALKQRVEFRKGLNDELSVYDLLGELSDTSTPMQIEEVMDVILQQLLCNKSVDECIRISNKSVFKNSLTTLLKSENFNAHFIGLSILSVLSEKVPGVEMTALFTECKELLLGLMTDKNPEVQSAAAVVIDLFIDRLPLEQLSELVDYPNFQSGLTALFDSKKEAILEKAFSITGRLLSKKVESSKLRFIKEKKLKKLKTFKRGKVSKFKNNATIVLAQIYPSPVNLKALSKIKGAKEPKGRFSSSVSG